MFASRLCNIVFLAAPWRIYDPTKMHPPSLSTFYDPICFLISLLYILRSIKILIMGRITRLVVIELKILNLELYNSFQSSIGINRNQDFAVDAALVSVKDIHIPNCYIKETC